MKIAFLSSRDPTDIHNWSGTLYHMYTSLNKRHHVIWIGSETLAKVLAFHESNYKQEYFIPEKYAMLFGKLLSDLFKYEYYDLIVCRDYFFCAYIVTNIPLIYIGDTTFRLFNQHMNIPNNDFARFADDLEYRAIKKADKIIYCSEWAKESAIRDYHTQPGKVEVIEFGVNINQKNNNKRILSPSLTCNLLFVGVDWKRKGGDKALQAYRALIKKGLSCTLTIVGCQIPYPVEDENIKIYPFLDKATKKGYQLLQDLFSRSHFLVVPTNFDCYGIVFCEAAAYGLPSLASDVGGVAQIIRDGQNGFLFSLQADGAEYADKIIEVLENDTYKAISNAALAHFKKRLNWDIWLSKIDKVMLDLIEEKNDTYIPVYVINMKDRTERRNHIMKEFSELTAHKMVIYPFISEQKDFGYSDVTQSNMDNQGKIRQHFAWANRQFEMLRQAEETFCVK